METGRKKKKKNNNNNAKFSVHYVRPHTHTVHAHALRSHKKCVIIMAPKSCRLTPTIETLPPLRPSHHWDPPNMRPSKHSFIFENIILIRNREWSILLYNQGLLFWSTQISLILKRRLCLRLYTLFCFLVHSFIPLNCISLHWIVFIALYFIVLKFI